MIINSKFFLVGFTYLLSVVTINIIIIMNAIIIPITNEIHNGANTHHQDQLITWINLSTTNAIVSNPMEIIPPVLIW